MKAISNETLQLAIDTLEALIGDGFEDVMPLYDELVAINAKPDSPMEKLRYQQGFNDGRLLVEADLKRCWVEIDRLKDMYYAENERLTNMLLNREPIFNAKKIDKV